MSDDPTTTPTTPMPSAIPPQQPVDYASPTTSLPPLADWSPADWFWLAVLLASLLVGLGMTAFAPI